MNLDELKVDDMILYQHLAADILVNPTDKLWGKVFVYVDETTMVSSGTIEYNNAKPDQLRLIGYPTVIRHWKSYSVFDPNNDPRNYALIDRDSKLYKDVLSHLKIEKITIAESLKAALKIADVLEISLFVQRNIVNAINNLNLNSRSIAKLKTQLRNTLHAYGHKTIFPDINIRFNNHDMGKLDFHVDVTHKTRVPKVKTAVVPKKTFNRLNML